VFNQRPGCLEVRPQNVASNTLVAFTAQPGHHEVAYIEEGAEESGKEHHLREDEPDHTPYIGAFELITVQSGVILTDDSAEPLEQHECQDQKTDHRHQYGTRGALRSLDIVQDMTKAVNSHSKTD